MRAHVWGILIAFVIGFLIINYTEPQKSKNLPILSKP